MTETTNPFTETDITNMAQANTIRGHALARLKDQQCMDSLRERIVELEKQADVARIREECRKWRPMETAPSDRRILVFCGDTREPFVAQQMISQTTGNVDWIIARGIIEAKIVTGTEANR